MIGWMEHLNERLFKLLRLDTQSVLNYPPGKADELAFWMVLLLVDLYVVFFALYRTWLVFYPPAPDAPRPRWWVALGRGLLLALLPLLAVELGLRAWVGAQPTPKPYLPHPTYLWRFPPNEEITVFTPLGPQTITTNAKGLRDREIPLEKAPGEFRILVLGDSHTFGQSVELDKTYPKVLQRMLEEKYPDRKFTVINAGIPGYSILQGYYFFVDVGLQYHPDLVVVSEFNEFQDRQMGEFASNVPRSDFGRWVKTKLWDSMLYLTLNKEMMRFVRPEVKQGGDKDDSEQPILSADETTWFVGQFARVFQARHIRGIFVLWRRSQVWTPIYTKVLEGIPKEDSIVYQDFHSRLLGSHAKEYWLPNDPSHHPGVRGHEMIAEGLFKTIEVNDMVR